MINNILSLSVGLVSAGIIGLIGLLFYLVSNPEKIELWGSMLFKVGSYFSKRSEKKFMSTNIQGIVNQQRKSSGIKSDNLPYGLKIQWTEHEEAEIDLRDNNVLIMVKPFKSQSKNLATIISLYIPKALLPKARNYVDPKLMKGVDYTLSKSFLEQNPPALQYYIDNESINHNEEIRQIISEVENIHSSGRLTRILLHELQKLGALYPSEPDKEVYKESLELLDEIYELEIAEPETDDDIVRGVYNGENCKFAIVTVGEPTTVYSRRVQPHIKFIKKHMDAGIHSFYIISAGQTNIFAKTLTRKACSKYCLNLVFEDEYKGTFRDRTLKMYCALCDICK